MPTKRQTMTKMKTGKINIFPIQNSSACVFKWGWNTFRLHSGESSSCHRVDPVPVSIENFENFHNTPEVIDDRRKMLNGEWPGRGCEYCKNIEDQGGISDRLYHNNIPGLTPVDFDGGGVVTPSISEVYLHNTCDLACVYCSPVFSEKVNQELKKFGPYPIGIQPVVEHQDRDKFFDAYITWLKINGNKLTRLSILGGEPLLQKEFWQILELLPEINNRNLELSINTNLNCSSTTIQRLIDTARDLTVSRSIKQIHVSASLDCWGEQAEFVRSGLNIEHWQKNFEDLASNKWINLSVHQVITSLTIKTASELQQRIAEYKKDYPKILQEYYLVDSGYEKIYHPEIFGKDFFKQELEHLLNTFPVVTEWDNNSRQRLEGIVKLISNSTADISRLQLLKQTLTQLDYRRGTNWKLLWPEIDQYFDQHGI